MIKFEWLKVLGCKINNKLLINEDKYYCTLLILP